MEHTHQVNHNDILWFFYRKNFEIQGRPIESPRNLCRYFWSAVNGFGLWMFREAKLRILWGVALPAVIFYTILKSFTNGHENTLLSVLMVTTFLLSSLAFMTALWVTIDRLWQFMKTKTPRLFNVFITVGVIALIVFTVYAQRDTLRSDFESFLNIIKTGAFWGAIAAVALVFLAVIASVIPKRKQERFVRMIDTLTAALKAKKERICPGVDPPRGFTTSK